MTRKNRNTMSYADHLAASKPSKHEVKRFDPSSLDDPAEVAAAIKRVQAETSHLVRHPVVQPPAHVHRHRRGHGKQVHDD